MDLIVVESPTKAKTLARFLSGKYLFEASFGHVRDLPEKKIGIDIDHDFEPDYIQTVKQKERMAGINNLAEKAETIYLATDPDREGEAIAWHVADLLTGGHPVKRIVFHEITPKAIDEALANPRELDMKLVNAQQARRILDRLVGYKLSPLLWKKVRRGLSAGRVQSVAVRLVVEKEREIEAFKPEEFWTMQVELADSRNQGTFWSMLTKKNGEKFKITNQSEATQTEADLTGSSFLVDTVVKREVRKLPATPFTTSTLQQMAANKLGWSAKRTMQVAQGLYEEGLITYHRTDSTNLSDDALVSAGKFIRGQYGPEYALVSPRVYKTKSKVAQEAHEAIRPTDVFKNLKAENLAIAAKDALRLYDLIWRRFIACQMAEAVGEEIKVEIEARKASQNTYQLTATSLNMKFPGWLKVYENTTQTDEETDDEAKDEEGNKVLTLLEEGEKLDLSQIKKEQKFTQPPTRYNDAGLIKALEEMGIGRPSTYAPTLSTIQDRQYVEKTDPTTLPEGASRGQAKRFKPTALGVAVNDFLVANFPGIVDYQFTAKMEDELDEIATGDRQWQPTLAEFYKPFEKTLETVTETSARVKVEVESTGEKCPKCTEGEVVVRIGKFGKFLACSRYPECDYKGSFVNKTGIPCPKCGGEVIIKKTKSKKSFYGCSNYPKCDFASWTRPAPKASEGEARPAPKASEGEARPAPKASEGEAKPVVKLPDVSEVRPEVIVEPVG